MAKKGSANKSADIRNYKASNPNASPKEIAEALGKTGLIVSAQFVSTVLSNAKKKGGEVSKRGPKPKIAPVSGVGDGNGFAGNTVGNGLAAAMPIFKAANELLKVAGDRATAREVLDMVAALRS